MLRHTLTAIMALLLATLCATAQQYAGWQRYPVFHDRIDNVIETPSLVYYRSGASLFSFSPADDATYSYSSINKLSDNDVAEIYYNPQKKYLLVAYANGNIDLLYDNGKVVNLPDIRDAQISGSKAIRDVAFADGRIAVATAFGIVIYDDTKHQVVESGIYGTDIECIAIMAGRLLIYYRMPDGNYYVCHSPLSERHNSLDKFRKIGDGTYISMMRPVNDNVLLMQGRTTGKLHTRRMAFDRDGWHGQDDLGYAPISPVKDCAGGLYANTATELVVITDGKAQAVALPQPMQGQQIAMWDSPERLWAADSQGIARYDISASQPTVLYDKMIAADATTCEQVGYMRWSTDGERLYISNMEGSVYKSYAKTEGSENYQTTNIIERGYPRDASLMQASADHSYAIKYQASHADKRMYGDPKWIIEDPDNPDTYYCANNHEGLYVMRYNPATGGYDEAGKFTHRNSPIPESWGGSTRVQDVNIDPQGNLWVGHLGGQLYSILPADKRRLDPASIKVSDWVTTNIGRFDIEQKDMMIVFCRLSRMAFAFTGRDGAGLVAIDTKGTYADPSDDTMMHWSQFTDQDGNTFKHTRITFAIEDNRGCVWVGTSAGVFEISRPTDATNASMTVRRIKVPRNDGTNYADYLLDSDMVNWMALDHSGRKWIATEDSGIFLVSETGDAILKNYNKDNSPLPSNSVCSIECDRADNTVYVGTPKGLYTFLSDSAPVHDDFGEMYAYPNPVRPDYHGEVTITGLMENSIVKIADSAGNVVFQTRAEGGMARWDVCNAGGSRVKSGVYYAHAISSDGSSKSGAVAKILVIN